MCGLDDASQGPGGAWGATDWGMADEVPVRVVDNAGLRDTRSIWTTRSPGSRRTGDRPGNRIVLHSEMSPEFEHHGLASELARALLDDIRSRGLQVVAALPVRRAATSRAPRLRGSGERRSLTRLPWPHDDAPQHTSSHAATLTPRSELAELAPFGTERAVEVGEVLYRAGDDDYDFFVVLEGEVRDRPPRARRRRRGRDARPGPLPRRAQHADRATRVPRPRG